MKRDLKTRPFCECRCDEVTGDPSIFKLIRSVTVLLRMLPTLDLTCEENSTPVEVRCEFWGIQNSSSDFIGDRTCTSQPHLHPERLFTMFACRLQGPVQNYFSWIGRKYFSFIQNLTLSSERVHRAVR